MVTKKIRLRGQIFSLVIAENGCYLGAEIDGKMELQWGTVRTNVHHAMLYFMRTESTHVPYAEKLARITFLENGILVFEKRMVKCKKTISQKRIEELFRSQTLPRLTILEIYTRTEGLKKIFKRFGSESGDNYDVSWEKLVSAAKKGDIVKMWLSQKREEKKKG